MLSLNRPSVVQIAYIPKRPFPGLRRAPFFFVKRTGVKVSLGKITMTVDLAPENL